ncbi:MAG TPA: hypothetical protein VFK78_12885, partial [Gemmatimonadales bacterium]|nr:hypothetical protein [Gemmatimonadales bacterium]
MPDSFPLAGARIDYLHQRNVAALVYRHGDQVVNAFFWPEAGESGPTEETAVAGHPVFYWKHDGMEVWIVGDGSGAELERFVGRLREAMG